MTATPQPRPPHAVLPSSPEVLAIGWHFAGTAAFERLGCRVLSVIEPREVARQRREYPDAHVLTAADVTDVESVVAALHRADVSPGRFDVVASFHEFCLLTASVIAVLADAVSLPPNTVIALRDKFVQKTLAQARGIRTARFEFLATLADLADRPWDGPIVVKPLGGAACLDTSVVMSPAALDALLTASRPDAGPWLAESFVDGAELHVDGVVRAGRIVFASVSRYLRNVIAFQTGELIGSVLVEPSSRDPLLDEAVTLTAEVLPALEHHDGVFHLEAFQTEHGLVFGECAGRVGGGMIRETNQQRFGIDLIEEFARALLRLEPGRPEAAGPTSRFGWVQLPAPPGRLLRIPTESEGLAQPGCTAIRVLLQAGQLAPVTSTDSHSTGARAVVQGATESQLIERMHDLAAWFRTATITQNVDTTCPAYV